MTPIYLDNNATTRVAPVVFDAMAPYFRDRFGNASSVHTAGQSARNAVDLAREAVAAMLRARPGDITFTSNGSDAIRIALGGVVEANPTRRRLVTTRVEHSATTNFCRLLGERGYSVTQVAVDRTGRLDLDAFQQALSDDVAIVSVLYANNETGVVFPIPRLAAMARSCGIPLHVDAIQAPGRLPIDVSALGADLVSISAHKLHGPKGIGALWIRPGTRFRCPMTGARAPRERRDGTENVAAIVGFGAAAEIANASLGEMPRVAELRDRLENAILSNHLNASVAGGREERLANTTSICFDGIEAEAILIGLSERGVYVSSGAACSSGSIEPSHVLLAMGLTPSQARGAIRFSLSRETTAEEIDGAIACVDEVVTQLRS